MASKPKNRSAASTAAVAITLAMVAAAGDNGMQVPAEASNEWLANGYVEVNPDMVDNAGVATRITAKGREYLAQLAQGTQMQSTPSDPKPDTASTAQTQVESGAVSYEIETGIELPKSKRGGRTEVYPFEQLSVGNSFFVPKPLKSIASTVTSAKERAGYTENPAKQVKRRNGSMGPEKIYNKVFEARTATKVIDGKTVEGTRIFRTK